MIGAILAAGRGTRMGPLSASFAKTVLPICNKPLIAYHIDMMVELGIREILIVVGPLGHQVKETLGDGHAQHVAITYIEQEQPLGIAHAVSKLATWISSPFFLSLGDIFFETNGLDRMVALADRQATGGVLAVKREVGPNPIRRNFAVWTHESEPNRVVRVVEKPLYPTTSLKGCGLYLLSADIFSAARRTPRSSLRHEYELTDAIQILIDDGLPVFASETVTWDVNITHPGDLLDSNLYQLERLGLDNLISDSAFVHPAARLEHTVVGPFARILEPIHLKETVVFPSTQVSGSKCLERYILTPDSALHCPRETPRAPRA